MRIEKFKSGIYVNQDDYKTFKPTFINEVWEWGFYKKENGQNFF